MADANGNYTFAGVVNGSFTVTPSKSGYTFSPTSQPVNINGASQTGVNFTAQGTGFNVEHIGKHQSHLRRERCNGYIKRDVERDRPH